MTTTDTETRDGRGVAPGEVLWPLAFVLAGGWTVWTMPGFLVATGLATEGLARQTDPAGALDWLALALTLVFAAGGIATVRTRSIEAPIRTPFDRLSLFLGRVCMVLVAAAVAVMFYEVVLRYVIERPTLWANELSLWMAGFVFALSGLYTMQQRAHIAITIVHAALPRALRRICDVVSTALIVGFAATLAWGAFNEARDKFLRWETFGTAFDPPIPATLKPLIILTVVLIAVQAVLNLIVDWKADTAHDPLDGTLHTAGGDAPRKES